MAASLFAIGDAKLALCQLRTERRVRKGRPVPERAETAGVSGAVEQAILELLACGEGRSVAPEAVARRLQGEEWRKALPQVRAAAVGMARQGRLSILRHGRAVDPNGLKGVYRLGPAVEA